MYRAWLRSMTRLAAFLWVLMWVGGLLAPGTALAFHAGAQFDDLPGKGGGGGLFYTGAPSDKGWTCTACHLSAEGKISIQLGATPATLLQNNTYAPGQAYAIVVSLRGEHLGLGSGRSNFNGFALTVRDSQSRPAGNISGYAPEDFYQANPSTIITAGKVVGTTAWKFTWTAPAAGTGTVTFFVAMVDGNGANSPPTVTLTDPFGDDVAVGQVTLKDGSSSAQLVAPGLARPGEQHQVLPRRDAITAPALPYRQPLSLGGNCYEAQTGSPWSVHMGRSAIPDAARAAWLQQRYKRRYAVSARRHLHDWQSRFGRHWGVRGELGLLDVDDGGRRQ